MAGRALEEFIILPLDPALLQCLELGKNTIADLEIFAILFPALVNVFREHAVIGECQKYKGRQPKNAPDNAACK